jgi:hypothetical protein
VRSWRPERFFEMLQIVQKIFNIKRHRRGHSVGAICESRAIARLPIGGPVRGRLMVDSSEPSTYNLFGRQCHHHSFRIISSEVCKMLFLHTEGDGQSITGIQCDLDKFTKLDRRDSR